MPDTFADAPAPEPTVAPPPKRGVAWLAWLVILLAVGFEVLWPRLRPGRAKPRGEDASQRILADVQIRQLVGWAELFGQGNALYAAAKKSLDTGPVSERLRLVVLAGELDGPAEALAQLEQLRVQAEKQRVELTEKQGEVMEALEHLYHDREPKEGQPPKPLFREEDRAVLLRDLGWCGELALTPAGAADTAAREAVIRPARRFALTLAVVVGGGLLLGLVGLVGIVTWFVFFLTGHIRPAMPPPTRHGGVYAESFAVYMVVFLGLSIAHAFLPWRGPELLLNALGMLFSLGAGLVWPVLRGIRWHQVRQELGLTLGRHPLLQPLLGLVGYVLVLPVFGIGILVTLVLISIERRMQLGEHPEEHFAPVEQPSHPIVEWIGSPDLGLLLQVGLLACVLAPLVEETMFRGALYRHLRNASERRLGRVGSFVVSAIIVSFIFAVIHPQGLLAVPALMSLAIGLTVLREWRGSLLPSMMVHGIHNGLTTFVLVQALRS
jgi:membrane protease YdiL (CAAX protease family)